MQISVYLDTSEPPEKNNEDNINEEDLNNTSSKRGNYKRDREL